MKRFIFVLALVLGADPVVAEDAPPLRSLFFNAAEQETAEALAEKAALPGQGNIRLDAVFYYAPDDWVVWLQGERWTPQTRRDDLRITRVEPERVHLIWQDEQEVKRHMTLRPHEIYQIASGAIISAP